MPRVNISSNVERSSIDIGAFTCAVVKTVASALGMPENHVLAQMELGLHLSFQSNNEPAALVHVQCVGRIDTEHNPNTVKTLTDTVAKGLSVSPERVFIYLEDIPACNFGVNGKLLEN